MQSNNFVRISSSFFRSISAPFSNLFEWEFPVVLNEKKPSNLLLTLVKFGKSNIANVRNKTFKLKIDSAASGINWFLEALLKCQRPYAFLWSQCLLILKSMRSAQNKLWALNMQKKPENSRSNYMITKANVLLTSYKFH